MKTISYCLLLIFLASSHFYAQDLSNNALEKLDNKQLYNLFVEVSSDTLKAEIVSRFYLNKSRKEGDTIKMARAYFNLSFIFGPKKNIQYADSVIQLTKDLNHPIFPIRAYLQKGYQYYIMNDLINGNENYLLAYEIAKKNDDPNNQMYILNNLIRLKTIWGNKNEALELQKKSDVLFDHPKYLDGIKKTTSSEEEYQKALISDELFSIANYSFCYTYLKKLDSASFYIKKGVEKSKGFKGYGPTYDFFAIYFVRYGALVDLYTDRNERAIAKIDSLLEVQPNIDEEVMFDLTLIKGLSYLNMDAYDKGIFYLKRADSLYDLEESNIEPRQRVLFEKLLSHYTLKDNTEKRIEYLNKLLEVDSVFKINYQYFDPSIIKEFETPLLLKEKETLIKSLEDKNKKSTSLIWWITGFSVICIAFLMYYIVLQHRYKKRFEVLMKNKTPLKKTAPLPTSKRREVPSEIADAILKQLDRFEEKKEFLSQDVSLQDLAKSFGTNYNYLSKVINEEKGKSFTSYINDLRVVYVFEELKENLKLRKYTIKAIAHEIGFKSAESFSKAFFKLYGIYPSFYIKQLKKIKNKEKEAA